MIALALALHTVAATIWVGGMFFAHMALRPALPAMPPPERLGLWRRVLPRFFAWVWVAVATLLVTGYGVVYGGYGGFAGIGMHIQIMQVTGLVMMALYAVLYFGPYQRFKRAFDSGDLPAAAAAQGRIRQIIQINLPLGLITAAIGATGAFWTV